mmetsp:Transcript_37786/g.119367  ORF Transcript_37786/g.119367 Transcript_37786/m.119367 type:complete len:227 (-) Transcript_37786:680-1360(-)
MPAHGGDDGFDASSLNDLHLQLFTDAQVAQAHDGFLLHSRLVLVTVHGSSNGLNASGLADLHFGLVAERKVPQGTASLSHHVGAPDVTTNGVDEHAASSGLGDMSCELRVAANDVGESPARSLLNVLASFMPLHAPHDHVDAASPGHLPSRRLVSRQVSQGCAGLALHPLAVLMFEHGGDNAVDASALTDLDGHALVFGLSEDRVLEGSASLSLHAGDPCMALHSS